MRIKGKIDSQLEAAFWDRRLRLPTTFFRKYSAGDLTMRAMGISTIRQVLTGVTMSAALGGIFSLVSFGLMFYYDVGLALVAAVLASVFIAITFFLNRKQALQSHAQEASGQIAGLLLQLLNGISKLRVAGAEPRAFNVWSRQFASQRNHTLKVRTLANYGALLNTAVPVVGSIAIFAVVAGQSPRISVASFLAFHAAFGQFLSGIVGMNSAITRSISVFPTYRRLKPIMQTVPEVTPVKGAPGRLAGKIDINNVCFRYERNGPLILNHVSISVAPGEFVAVVGPSGSGKSTLFRLLLGFETPDLGTVFYDGKDLSKLNLRGVRRQLGVVLQNGSLMPGSIMENIRG